MQARDGVDCRGISDGSQRACGAVSLSRPATQASAPARNEICNGFFAEARKPKQRSTFESPVRLKLNARPLNLPAKEPPEMREDVKAQQDELRQVNPLNTHIAGPLPKMALVRHLRL